jgi:excisionase family DNA binding protein
LLQCRGRDEVNRQVLEVTEDEKLLSISEAARRLKISPSLLRKWVDQGVVRAIRLPNSGYRRFEPAEIERKRRELGLDT